MGRPDEAIKMTVTEMRKFSTSKIKDATYLLFFVLSVILVVGYLIMLSDNLTSQRLHYLETDDFIWIGFLMLGLIIIDLLITRRFVRRAKKRNR